MNATWLVVDDPAGEYPQGTLVDANRRRQLEARAVALLPVDSNLFKVSGVGGFHYRAWGKGWALDTSAPRLVCPLTLYLTPHHRVLHWCARLLLDDGNGDPAHVPMLTGFLRISCDGSQAIAQKLGVMPRDAVDARALTASRMRGGGFDVGGVADVSAMMDGHYGIALYGTAPGLRVAWAAASVVAE